MTSIIALIIAGVVVLWLVPQFPIVDAILELIGAVLVCRACWIVYVRPLISDIKRELAGKEDAP